MEKTPQMTCASADGEGEGQRSSEWGRGVPGGAGEEVLGRGSSH